MTRTPIRSPGAFWSGVLLWGFGLGFALLAPGYGLGRLTRMGPGFFPLVLGLALVAIGCAAILRGLLREGPAVDRIAVAPIALVLGGTVAFGALLRDAGLVAALVVVVLVSARASPTFRWYSATLLAAGVVAASVLVFVAGLGLPVPVVPRWPTG